MGLARCWVETPHHVRYELDSRSMITGQMPAPFNWGSASAGASRLSFSIIADHFNTESSVRSTLSDMIAMALYPEFQRTFVARQPHDGFTIDADGIVRLLIPALKDLSGPISYVFARFAAREFALAARFRRPAPTFAMLKSQMVATLVAGLNLSTQQAREFVQSVPLLELYETDARDTRATA